MSTPTREQVIEWAKEADLLDARDDESTVPGCYGAGLERFATPPEPFRPSIEAAHAIEQLRGK